MNQKERDAYLKFIHRSQIDPLYWVKIRFGDNILQAQIASGRVRGAEFVHTGRPITTTGLSYQQEDILRQWGALLGAKLAKSRGDKLTPEQVVLSDKIGISIQSANGTGKDFLGAIMKWHFMECFSDCKILATANSKDQLKTVFWSEVSKVRGMALRPTPESPNIFQDMFEVQSEMSYAKLPDKEERGKRWFCSLRTVNAKATPDEQAATLSGLHEDHMLFLLDECSEIPDAVFKPIDRTLTGKLNVAILIFNPTRNTGFAIRSQEENAAMWVTVQLNAIDSDNVDRSQIERLKRYGDNSPAYRIGVLGLPPITSANTLISYEHIKAAIDRELEPSPFDPVICAVDAGGGGDRSIVCISEGPNVLPFHEKLTSDPDDLLDWSSGILLKAEATVVFVDNIGLGWYLPKNLRNRGLDAKPADSRSTREFTGNDDTRFINMRAKMYWNLKEDFENACISIPNDPELVNELGAITFENVGQKIKIEDKKGIRRKLGFSPDKADALAMTRYKPHSLYRKGKKAVVKEFEFVDHHWMGA